MTGCRDMDKKHQKYPKNGFFPHLWPPKIFFQKSGSVTIVPLWCPNFMQKIRKNQWAVSEIFKAIGGQGQKIMLSLFERSPRAWTEAFYGMSKFSRVQKLLHFEVRDFGRISYKKIWQIWNLKYFTQNVSGVAIFVRFCSNLHQSPLTYILTIWIFDILKIEGFMLILHGKNSENCNFRHFL